MVLMTQLKPAGARERTTGRTAGREKRTARLVGPAPSDAATPTRIAQKAAELAAQSREAFDRLVDVLMPPAPAVPDETFVVQARRNAALRAAVLDQYPTVTAEQVARMAANDARNRAALANRWRQGGRIFGVPVAGAYRYPIFQFSANGQPREAMRRLVALFPPTAREWQLFVWLTSENLFLDGSRPLDLLDSDLEGVLHAAALEFDTSRF